MVTNFLIFASILIAILIIGKIFFSLLDIDFYKEAKKFSRLFYESLFGATTVVTVYSIYRTSGQTIFTIFPILFLLFISYTYKKNAAGKNFILNLKTSFTFGNNLKNFAALFICMLAIYFYNSIFFYSYTHHSLIANYDDYFFYGRVSSYLEYWGKENIFYAYNKDIATSLNGISLYHFYDLWLNTSITKILGTNSYETLYTVTTPLLLTILFIGFVSLWEDAKDLNWKKIIFTILFFFIGATHFGILDRFYYSRYIIPFLTDSGPLSLFGRKLIPISLFAILAVKLFSQKKNLYGYITLVLTVVVYSGGLFLPVISGISVYLLKLFIKQRSKYWKVIISTSATILLIVVFVYANLAHNSTGDFVEKSLLNSTNVSELFSNIRTALGNTASLFLIFCITYFPYFLLLLLFRKYVYKMVAVIKIYSLLTILFMLAGLFFSFVFYLPLDGKQFFTNTLPFLNIFIIVFVIQLLSNIEIKEKVKFLTVIAILVFATQTILYTYKKQIYFPALSEKYAEDFLNTVKNETTLIPKGTIIAYRIKEPPPPRIFERPLFSQFNFLDALGYGNYINNSTVDIRNINAYQNASLPNFIKENISDTSNYQLNYLLRNNIKILVSDKVETNIPNEYIKSKYLDKKTGEIIYFFK